jgi:hypothetical protein
VPRILQNRGVPSTTSTSPKAKIQAVQLSSGSLLFSDRDGRKFVLKPKANLGVTPSSTVGLAGKRAPAPPVYVPVPPPEKLQDVFTASPSLQVVWERACACASAQCRLLIRANRLHELLVDLGTTRYRMGCLGLQPVCRAGIHTSLYSLADVLARYVCSASDQVLPLLPLRDALERVILKSIHRRYGAEIHWQALPEILGGSSLCKRLIKSGELVPSFKTRRCTLFPLKAIEDIAGRLQGGWVPPVRMVARQGRAR